MSTLTRRAVLASALATPLLVPRKALADPGWCEPDHPAHPCPVEPPQGWGPRMGQSPEFVAAVVASIPAARIYFQPGEFSSSSTPRTWSTPAGDGSIVNLQRAVTLGCTRFHFSFKDAAQAGAANKIAGFVATIPDGIQATLTFFHEHNGNIRDGTLTLAQYRTGSKIIADIAHAYGHRYGPIHNGVNRQFGSTGPWGLWPSQWAAAEADVSLYDTWMFDCYAPNTQSPESRFTIPFNYGTGLGLPVSLMETGAPPGPGQAPWAAAARQFGLGHFESTLWWSNQSSAQAIDYRLRGATAEAWYGLT